ncbi:sulfite exporter TauE/SafE family protein [Streptomyces sp. NPDC059740]|uniref:sulfite exporter TauE/SafE family protein n=1 Tax=Streptomyces sp. NPDC059740 TaxID=3346926 RepID=UPI0036555BD1
MTIWEALAVFAAGVGAGGINTVVGSGSLITFPVLLGVGLPPLTANVSNSLGLVPGSLSGALGYRRELRGQRRRLVRFGAAAAVGGLAGAIALLALPSSAFDAIVPVLVGLAVLLVAVGPRLSAAVRARRPEGVRHPEGGPGLLVGLALASAYGGYFGAAQGVLYLSLMGLLLDEELQRLNAVKNVLALVVNGVAAIFFLFVAHFDWPAVGLIAAGSVIGGQIGARLGRRLSPTALRVTVVVVGCVALAQLLIR